MPGAAQLPSTPCAIANLLTSVHALLAPSGTPCTAEAAATPAVNPAPAQQAPLADTLHSCITPAWWSTCTAQLSHSAAYVEQLAAMGLQVLRSFGAGVILATGFVHMFPDASAALGSECLGWPASFPWAAFIALMTSLAVLVSPSRWTLLKHRWLLEGSAMFGCSLFR